MTSKYRVTHEWLNRLQSRLDVYEVHGDGQPPTRVAAMLRRAPVPALMGGALGGKDEPRTWELLYAGEYGDETLTFTSWAEAKAALCRALAAA